MIVDATTESARQAMSLIGHLKKAPVNIKIEANGRLEFVGFDEPHYTMLRVVVEAEVARAGAVLVNNRTFAGLVAKAPAEKINLKVTDGWARMTSGVDIDRTPATGTSSFPRTPAPPDETIAIAEGYKLKAILGRVKKFIPDDGEDNRAPRALKLTIGNDKISAYATDGRRFARAEFAHKTENDPVVLIVPAWAIGTMERLLHVEQGECRLSLDPAKVYLETNTAAIWVPGSEDKIVDYTARLTDQLPNKCKVSGEELEAALFRLTTAVTTGKGGFVWVKFTANEIQLFAQHQTESFTRVKDVQYSGPETKIGFNHKYLLQSVAGSEGLEVTFDSPTHPVMFRHTDDGYNSQFVVLPMNP